MQSLRSQREESHDTLCEELLRERAAVLARAGRAVEDALAELTKLEHQIKIIQEQLKTLVIQEPDDDDLQEQQMLITEINLIIDQFNTVRKTAQLKYYYLIVTREAMGLRRHNMIQETYIIPARKKKMQAF
ncbi:MAG: hypothetical protein CVU54_00745 [Deltaproteobacteria bacterium HGW-Deltaproteobacteria-12]|jgi:hypothetical protein|nr:MAG: hypothetical protein CVU54_00745 [Deltaproteobacteria bacterium HGW-Deltaproteobacteria-12]